MTATRKHRPRRPSVPNRPFDVSKLNGFGDDIDIDALKLDGKRMDAQIGNGILTAELERTIEGASTITLGVHDEYRKLLHKDALSTSSQIELDGLFFKLRKVAKDQQVLTLTFEDRIVSWLRKYNKPKKAYRDQVTRAEFILSMVNEANKSGHIGFYAPELHVKQAIKGGDQKTSIHSRRIVDQSRDTSRGRGIAKGAHITIKGVRATNWQIHLLNTILDVAGNEGAGPHARLASICAAIGESTVHELPPTSGHSYAGVFQANQVDYHDTARQAHYFFRGGKGFGAGGAIAYSKANPGASPGTIATKVEVSGEPGSFYDAYLSEAKAIVAAYGHGSGRSEFSTRTERSGTRVKRYAFTRGSGGKRENSWDASGRLADEVGWRRFVVGDTLYYASEEYLFESRPRATVSEDTPGIDWINFEYDIGHASSEMTIIGRAKRWAAPPGTVIVVEDSGPANDRWLVTTIARSLLDEDATITLKQPQPELPEPAPETSQVGRQRGGGVSVRGGSHSGYVNPLSQVQNLQKLRIDQGVDYGGHGPILAIGRCKITQVGAPGWPGGGGCAYRLLDGKYKGREVYVFEHVTTHVHVGQVCPAGHRIATLHEGSPWSEHGWYKNGRTLSQVNGTQGSKDSPGGTPEGRHFAKFLHSLGAPVIGY